MWPLYVCQSLQLIHHSCNRLLLPSWELSYKNRSHNFYFYPPLPSTVHGSWKAEHKYLLNKWMNQSINLVQCTHSTVKPKSTLLVNGTGRTTCDVLISQISQPLVYSSCYSYLKTCMHNRKLNQNWKKFTWNHWDKFWPALENTIFNIYNWSFIS